MRRDITSSRRLLIVYHSVSHLKKLVTLDTQYNTVIIDMIGEFAHVKHYYLFESIFLTVKTQDSIFVKYFEMWLLF